MKNNIRLSFLLISIFLFYGNVTAQTWDWAVGSRCPGNDIESNPIAADRYGHVYEAGVMGVSTPDSGVAFFGPFAVRDSSPVHEALVLVSSDSHGNYRWAIGAGYGLGEVRNIVADA